MFPEGEFSLSQRKRKKDATTMVCTNMILIGTLKDNMNFDVLTRRHFQFTYFLLFLPQERRPVLNRAKLRIFEKRAICKIFKKTTMLTQYTLRIGYYKLLKVTKINVCDGGVLSDTRQWLHTI